MTNMHALWLFGLLHPFLQRMPREPAFEALRESVERQYMSQEDLEVVFKLWAGAERTAGDTNPEVGKPK